MRDVEERGQHQVYLGSHRAGIELRSNVTDIIFFFRLCFIFMIK